MWYIWKMRNEILFQNISPLLPDLASRRAYELQQWNSSATFRGLQQDWPWSIAGLLASIARILFWNQHIEVVKSPRDTVQQ
ncbi:hypothetical protein LINPERPRIM_LOCUS323, partial [Linum perenne]